MSRAKSAVARKLRHKKIIKLAKGYRGRSKNCFRIAKQRVHKALQYSYRDRRTKKREFRSLWIQRINAALRERNIVYSRFMKELRLSQHNINRKILSELAIRQPLIFDKLIQLIMSR